jgi:hypothetical protein
MTGAPLSRSGGRPQRRNGVHDNRPGEAPCTLKVKLGPFRETRRDVKLPVEPMRSSSSASLAPAVSSVPSASSSALALGAEPSTLPSVRFAVQAHGGPSPVARARLVDPNLATALATLARVFAPFVAAELREATSGQDAEPWLDQTCSPLGRRLHCALARSGALPARKMGRRWLVRRTDIDAYILKHGRAAEPAAPSTETDGDIDQAEVRALLAKCGVVAAAPVPDSRIKMSPRPKALRRVR